MSQWEDGKRQTLKFYYLKSKWKFRQFNKKFRLATYFDSMIGDKKEVKIADLGAGVVSTTGNQHPSAKIILYPSDILADKFNEFLRRKDKRWGKDLENGYKPLYPIEQQDMENLTYENNFFDIVHAVNALDHCNNAYNAIKEMYRVCKPGGWIYLRHFPDNARGQHYQGFHQWNITPTRDDCLFWSRERQFFLSECVPGFKTEVRRELDYEPDNMVISKAQK